jgi:glycosyltransferase involved in cell wall biosynthesis
MGTLAKRLVAERFTWEAVAEQLEQIYAAVKKKD